MNSLKFLLNRWRVDESIGTNVTAWRIIPPRLGDFVPFPDNIDTTLKRSLEQLGIRKFYTHQSNSWDLTQDGMNVVVMTGTASGKTLCYNIPVLHELLAHEKARAMYLFPTKALAQDQLSFITKILKQIKKEDHVHEIFPATYDGDTPYNVRKSIRKKSRLILSNPDMLHAGILPYHTNWASFFKGLHYIVIDEVHTYRGVFGSHVTNVIRRLKRIASFYNTKLQFILTSATIGNPVELAEQLVEEPISLICRDGSARGAKHFLVYNPPVIDQDLGLRAPIVQETVRLAADLSNFRIQTIIFGRTRRTVEILLNTLRLNTAAINHNQSEDIIKFIRAYRSGYLPRQRREIEIGLRQGDVRTVIATTALELGIDIGQLEAAILAGYPGSISGTWQQAGRAGRGQDISLAILVSSASPLDQFIAKHPNFIFEQPFEKARINPNNLLVLLDHLRCASFELAFTDGDSFGDLDSELTSEYLQYLRSEGVLLKSGNKFFWMSDTNPSGSVSLRNASADRYLLQDNSGDKTEIIGEVDGESALWMAHPQAIYMHEGSVYLVDDLDLESKTAHLRPVSVDYYTKPVMETKVELIDTFAEEPIEGGYKAYGDISVTTQVTGFHKILWETHEKISSHELMLPPSELLTSAYWINLDSMIVSELRREGLWSNDPNNYGNTWNQQRDLARKRDNFRCQVCGSLEIGRPHHVHHKIPFRSFNNPQKANQLANLVTLCPKCHQRVESRIRIRSGLAGVSYILVNLAPIYVMCDVRDLGIHFDPKSSLNYGEPTIVIYEQVPGGIGFSQILYEIHDELFARSYELASSCECYDGCPSCVGPGGELGNGGKSEALALLKSLLKQG